MRTEDVLIPPLFPPPTVKREEEVFALLLDACYRFVNYQVQLGIIKGKYK